MQMHMKRVDVNSRFSFGLGKTGDVEVVGGRLPEEWPANVIPSCRPFEISPERLPNKERNLSL